MIEFIKGMDKGKDFQFNIEGGAYQTFLGGITTILTGIAFLILLWVYGKDMYERKSPSVLSKKSMIKFFPEVKVNSSTFNFAYRMENLNGDFINDPRYFTYDFMHIYEKADENGHFSLVKKEKRKMEKCSLDHTANETLHHYKLHNYMCINNNYTFGGDWGGDSMRLPLFFIRRCNNETEAEYGIKCMTNEEIHKTYGNDLFVDTYIQKNLVNPSKYDSPIQATFTYKFRDYDFTGSKAVVQRLTYSTASITTDIGWFFQDQSTQHFLEYQNTDLSYTEPQASRGDYVAMVQLYISKNHQEYERDYKKISDALADVGGIMSLFTMVIDIMMSYYIDLSYNLYLLGKLLKLKKEVSNPNKQNMQLINMEKTKISDSLSKEKETRLENVTHDESKVNVLNPNEKPFKKDCKDCKSPIHPSTKLYQKKYLNLSNKEIILNKEISKVIEYKKHELQEVQLICCDWLSLKYCCFNKKKEGDKEKVTKYELLKAGEREVEKKIEVLDLIRMMDQFRLIKKLILNENQCHMLANREMTNIIDSRVMTAEEEYKENKAKEEKGKSALVEYLLKKHEEGNLNQVDVLLFKYMEPKVKEEIQKAVRFSI